MKLWASSAEWLQEDMGSTELWERRDVSPTSRPLDFQLDLTRDFMWKYPLAAGRRPHHNTVLKFELLEPGPALHPKI